MKNIDLSPLELHPGSPIRRAMPRPLHLRQPDYEEKFDFTTVFYDCFRSLDRQLVRLDRAASNQSLTSRDPGHSKFFSLPVVIRRAFDLSCAWKVS